MAHVVKVKTQSGDDRYVVRFRDPNGKQREEWKKTRKEANARRSAVEVALGRGGWVDPRAGKVTVAAYATAWLSERPNLRPRTRETYESLLRRHVEPELGGVELGKVTPPLVRKWYAGLLHKGLSANTAAKCYRTLSAVLTTAVADERIVRNPCVIKGASVERCEERPVATVDQVWAMAEAMPEQLRCLILVAGFAGLRVGELLGLERRHVNLLHRTITVEQQEQERADGTLIVTPPKTAAGRRVIAIPAFLVDELEHHLARFGDPEPTGRVFRGTQGGTLRRHTLRLAFQRSKRLADLPDRFTLHDLRHTANTLTAAAGASTRELMARMGHASPAAALRYQHATEQRDAALADLLGDYVTRAREADNAAVARLS